MNKKTLASELVKVAQSLMAIEFDSKKEMEDYKKEHDVKPGTKLEVVKEEKGEGKPTNVKVNLKKDHPEIHKKVSDAVEFAKKITEMTPKQLSQEHHVRTFDKIGDLGSGLYKKFKDSDKELASLGKSLMIAGHGWMGLPERSDDEVAEKKQDEKNAIATRDKIVDTLSKIEQHLS